MFPSRHLAQPRPAALSPTRPAVSPPPPTTRGRTGPSPPMATGGGGPGALDRRPPASVTVTTAGDVPANVAVGPYLFDLAIGLHISDSKSPSEVIQARHRGGTLAVEGEPSPRWLVYVQAARDRHEQTLEAVRDPRGYIYYRTVRPLQGGEELLVWYGDELARECGIPALTPDNIRGDQQYVCTNCSKSYKHPNCLKAHIRFRCCAQTRLDLLVAARSAGSWFRLSPGGSLGPRSSPHTHTHDESQHSASPTGPVNLKIGETSAFKPHRRSSDPRRLSPESIPRTCHRERVRDSKDPSRPKCSPPARADRLQMPSPSKAVSLKEPPPPTPLHKFTRTDPASGLSPPFQIFNHIHPPSIPIPVENAALKYYYGSLYGRLSGGSPAQFCCTRGMTQPCLTNGYLSSAIYPYGLPKVLASPDQDHQLDTALKAPPAAHTAAEGAADGACLPFSFPLPSEKAGEPLDLLPRSLYMHKSRKGHLCIYCGKLYSRKYGLKIHLRTHTGYKPLKCKVCLRPFGDPSNLNKHIRLHAEGDTPYRCDYCGKVLVRRRDLERHIKSRHPNEATKLCGDGDADVARSESDSPLNVDDDGTMSPDHCVESSSAESVGSVDSATMDDCKDMDLCDIDVDEAVQDEEDDDMCEIEVVS